MPVTKGTYADVETIAYDYITKELGFNTAIACGILANIEHESNFNPHIVNPIGAYGLIQWLGGRKTNLFKYTKTSKPSALQQMRFMGYELNNSESKAKAAIEGLPNTASGAYEAGRLFGYRYERFDTNPYSQEGIDRATDARDKYWSYYSSNPQAGATTLGLGQIIVNIARTLVSMKVPYLSGGEDNTGVDDAGLVYLCYTTAGKFIVRGSASTMYNEYKSIAKKVSESDVAAGDLLFYKTSSNIAGVDHIAIATGTGSRIHSLNSSGVIEESGIGDPEYILRILTDAETNPGLTLSPPPEGMDPFVYTDITSHDPYAVIATTDSLSVMEADGYDYGYLIDMTHGGSFKFYVPEFSEQAGANWEDVDIRGRSVTVKSYNSTSSRTITVSLDLYAGAGVYAATSSEDGSATVSRLHQDAYFVKSLEYPDYTTAITKPPAVVNLILGSAINLTGVVSQVTVEHMKPLDRQNRAMYLKLSFTVTQIASNPIDYRDVRSSQSSMVNSDNIDSNGDIPYLGTPAASYAEESRFAPDGIEPPFSVSR